MQAPNGHRTPRMRCIWVWNEVHPVRTPPPPLCVRYTPLGEGWWCWAGSVDAAAAPCGNGMSVRTEGAARRLGCATEIRAPSPPVRSPDRWTGQGDGQTAPALSVRPPFPPTDTWVNQPVVLAAVGAAVNGGGGHGVVVGWRHSTTPPPPFPPRGCLSQRWPHRRRGAGRGG